MAAAKKKGAAPKTSPKHQQAEVRKVLFEQLAEPEAKARALLASINKLRHGDLDLVSGLPAMAEQAEDICDDLERIAGALA